MTMRREELLSLRLHEAVAHKLEASPELILSVEGRVERLFRIGQLHPHYRAAWLAWLSLDADERLRALVSVEDL